MAIFELSSEQQYAVNLILQGHNVFLTGKAGSGKSVVVHYVQNYLLERNIVYLAPTGIAALQIKGQTIHKFFNFPGYLLRPDYVSQPYDEQKEVIRQTDTIIIDEISMVRADVMNAIETTLRHLCSDMPDGNSPFGGKQIIVVGDFYQLPPVAPNQDQHFLQQFHNGVFAFESTAWKLAEFAKVQLQQVHRQGNDLQFKNLLNSIRESGNDYQCPNLKSNLQWLNESVIIDAPLSQAPMLCTTREEADTYNQFCDSMLETEVFTFRGNIIGGYDPQTAPTHLNLELRMGSRVMITANKVNDFGETVYANGNVGIITDVDPSIPAVQVKLDDNRTVTVETARWTAWHYFVEHSDGSLKPHLNQKEIGYFQQIPLKLGYAITIHKSQGMSLERAHINLGKHTFASGQLYVALSRCRSLAGLSLSRPVQLSDVKLDPRVSNFMNNL